MQGALKVLLRLAFRPAIHRPRLRLHAGWRVATRRALANRWRL